MKRLLIIESVCILFAILFLYTGISKLIAYSVFKEQISESPALAPMAKYIALLLPWTEFFTAIALFIPRWRLKGLYASLALMIMFTSYIIAILAISKQIPCSCGGILEGLSWENHIIINSIFILLALIAILLNNRLIQKPA